MSAPRTLDRHASVAIATALVVGAAMLLSHPFTGVRHDGTLYAGDALARLLPGEFHRDLYFYFGSQGRFTFLPTLYAQLIRVFGLGYGTMVGLFTAFALYLAATAYVIAWLAPKPLRLVCILSVVLGWTLYGGLRIFAYSEPFLTARSVAEPFVLFGIGALLRGRRVAALALLVVAFAIHPLVATTGAAFGWVFLLARDRRWLYPAVAGALLLVALAITGVGPFADVFTRYDDAWLALVQDINAQAFVSRWSLFDYGSIAFDLAVLWFVARSEGSERLRRFLVAVVATGLGACVVSLVTVDLLHNPFFGKLQIWRALWIVHWVAMATLPVGVHALWRRDRSGGVIACLLAMGWMAPFSMAPGILAVVAVVIEALRDRSPISATTLRFVRLAALLAGVIIVVQYEAKIVKSGLVFHESAATVIAQILAMNIVLFVAALALVRMLPRLGLAAPLAGLAVFILALTLWDQRGPWARQLESYPLGSQLWPGLIEPDARVYWYRDLIAPWVLLGHGNYYTQQQGSGAVFSRDMIVELDRRRKVTAGLDFQEQICRMMNGLSEQQGACEPDAEAVRGVCADGGVDYIVLQNRLEGRAPTADFATGVFENGYEKKFFLYRCSALNKG